MRYQGKITSWKDDKGYGFVVQNGAANRSSSTSSHSRIASVDQSATRSSPTKSPLMPMVENGPKTSNSSVISLLKRVQLKADHFQ